MNRRTISNLVTATAIAAAGWWSYAQEPLEVGYVAVSRDAGSGLPVGTAVFSNTNGDGVLLSEAGVGAVKPVTRGRIFVDQDGTRTGVALVNPGTESAVVNMVLRDTAGTAAGSESLVLNPGEHFARFVDELFGTAAGFRGSLTFESASGLAAITLRESRNGIGEAIFTTLPVVELDEAAGDDAVVFPHLAVGGGYRTQAILINRSGDSISGRIQVVGSDGTPLQVAWDGVEASEGRYEIPSDGVYRVDWSSTVAEPKAGYAVVTPEVGTTPAGSLVFQFRSNGQLVTEAGVGATPATTAARISLDNVGRQTGVALANPGTQDAEVRLILQDRFGDDQREVTETIPAGGHLARMAQSLFPSLELGFNGLMAIESTVPIIPITLQLTINTRRDLVLTTLPVADLTVTTTSEQMIFPHIAIGGGFTTRFVFMNGDASTIRMNFHRSDGTAMVVPIGGETSNEFTYDFASGERQRLFPGDTATVSSLSLRDPLTNQPTTEVTINEGNTVRPQILALDSTGKARDEFNLSLTSLDTTVATIATNGQITGHQRGFSTLTIQSGDRVTTATITVVGIESGVTGAFGTGIAEDLAGRVYLASTGEHTVVRAESLSQAPELYAGMRQTPGLKNDLRAQSQFASPAFLTLDQSGGDLYVSDAANHVIRTVGPGPNGRTETLAGTGTPGSTDGEPNQASFNNPQGVVLDSRGHLWVADTHNHTIRRINLVTGEVETIAGLAGQAGFADGSGNTARLDQPTGIALEPETVADQLARDRRGDPPPPIRIIVADTGNNVIRRVTENGQVETLRQEAAVTGLSDAPTVRFAQHATPPITFDRPTAVSANRSGEMYVVVLGPEGVRVILRSGDLVAASQGGTFGGATSVVADRRGGVLVAGGNGALLEAGYGGPLITSVTPESVDIQGGAVLTIRGRNFVPDSLLVVAGVIVAAQVLDTQTITFVAPPLPSGRTTLTVQTRGGLAQVSLLVEAIPLNALLTGHVTTIAGGTTFGGDGSTAEMASIDPERIALDSSGNLYFTDGISTVRKVDLDTGIVTTVAGTGQRAFSGDGGPAIAADLGQPHGMAIDSSGNLLISDRGNNRIRKLDVTTGIITTVAGSNPRGFSGDGGRATEASLFLPEDVSIDSTGDLLIADTGNHRIRKVDVSTGIITTVAGTGQAGFFGDGGPASEAALSRPLGVAADSSGNVFIVDRDNHRIRKVDAVTGIITTVVGTGQRAFSGDGGPASEAALNLPEDVVVDVADNLLIADTLNHRIRRVDTATGIITTIAGTGQQGFSGDGGPATNAALDLPRGVAIDGAGTFFIASEGNHTVRKATVPSGMISTIVGSGPSSFSGDGGPATGAMLKAPDGVALDSVGNVYIADSTNNRIRRMDAVTGIITTVAGTGQYGFSGDGGLAVAATLRRPQGVSVDLGSLFMADTENNRIRKVDVVTGIITTVAGTGQVGFSGDGGLATGAMLSEPEGVAVDFEGTLYIAVISIT